MIFRGLQATPCPIQTNASRNRPPGPLPELPAGFSLAGVRCANDSKSATALGEKWRWRAQARWRACESATSTTPPTVAMIIWPTAPLAANPRAPKR